MPRSTPVSCGVLFQLAVRVSLVESNRTIDSSHEMDYRFRSAFCRASSIGE